MSSGPARARCAGITMVELIVAVAAGLLLVGIIGYVFVRQVKSYSDIQVQTEMQAQTKMATRVLGREIANAGSGVTAGAYFPNHSNVLRKNSGIIRFSYRDLKTRHCASEADLVTVTYRVRPHPKGEALVQGIQCGSGATVNDTIIRTDSVALDCAYLDRNRNKISSWNEANLRAVECTVTVKAKTHKDFFDRKRRPVVSVRLGRT